jgi:hypothetical protein
LVQCVNGQLQIAWAANIISGYPLEIFSSCIFEDAVKIGSCSDIDFLANVANSGILARELFADLRRLIGRSVVTDHQLKIGKRLVEGALNGGGHKAFTIVDWDYFFGRREKPGLMFSSATQQEAPTSGFTRAFIREMWWEWSS